MFKIFQNIKHPSFLGHRHHRPKAIAYSAYAIAGPEIYTEQLKDEYWQLLF